MHLATAGRVRTGLNFRAGGRYTCDRYKKMNISKQGYSAGFGYVTVQGSDQGRVGLLHVVFIETLSMTSGIHS